MEHQCSKQFRFSDYVWVIAILLLTLTSLVNTAPMFQINRRVELRGFMTPESAAVGPDGRYYISNIGSLNRDEDGTIKVISGNPFDGTAEVTDVATGLNGPSGILFMGTELFVVDQGMVWRIETAGEMAGEKTVFLPPEAFPGGSEQLNDIAADADENIYISDTRRGVIFKADLDGLVSIFLDEGPENPLRSPNGLLIDAEGQLSEQPGSLLVVDVTTGDLVAVAPDGSSAEVIGEGFGSGDGLVFDAQGNLYITDFLVGRVFRMAPDRTSEAIARTQSPADLTVDREKGWLIVPNFLRNRVTFMELE